MSIQTETFQMGQIASAIDASPQTIKAWLHKEIVTGHRKITGGGGAGKRRNFTFHNVMEFAVAKAIMDVGFQRDAEKAFNAATVFAHTGSGEIDGYQENRMPSFPYYDGFTLLCTSGKKTRVLQHDPGNDILPNIRNELLRPVSFITVDMSNVFDGVVTALGYHPQEQIDLAYKRG